MEKKSMGFVTKGVEPPANLFEQEEAVIAGGDIIIQYEIKGKVFFSNKANQPRF